MLTATKPGGWGLNEVLTSAQITAVDVNIENAVDKRSGQVDTIQSTITIGTGGSISFISGTTLDVLAGGIASLQGTTTIKDCTISDASAKLKLASRSVTRVPSYVFTPVNLSVWLVGPAETWFQTTDSGVGLIRFTPKHGQLLTGVTLYLRGATGHVALPTVKPKFALYKTAIATGVATPITAYTTDTSATVGAYEVPHSISASMSETVDLTAYKYWIEFVGEGAPNYLTNLEFYGMKITYTATSIDEY